MLLSVDSEEKTNIGGNVQPIEDAAALLVIQLFADSRRHRQHDAGMHRDECATYLGELEFSQEVIAAVLSHQPRDVTGIYTRYNYDKEKQAALLAWERRLRYILETHAV